jgi:hypothetical protein
MEMKVSVKDQKLALYDHGHPVRVYGVSTSKFGIGNDNSTYRTPVGKMKVVNKIGAGQPPGMVFKGRQATGEVLAPDAPGRDPVISRILWLGGSEAKTVNAQNRCIYIHGTPEERNIGRPSSFGCIRMRSMDVIDLYNRVALGTQVTVIPDGLPAGAKRLPEYVSRPAARPAGLPPAFGAGVNEALANQTPATPANDRVHSASAEQRPRAKTTPLQTAPPGVDKLS